MGMQDKMKQESEQAKQKAAAAAGKEMDQGKRKAEDQAKAAGRQAMEKAEGKMR